jgi:hypothetical protein
VTIIDAPPPIAGEKRFHGAHRYTTGTYEHDRNSMLAAGPGKLIGRITADGKPVQGLKLQLALNGTIFSQWGTSGADGRYEISVPYRQYRIDGYGLDHTSADAVLSGKIDNPRNVHDSGVFTVAEGRDGKSPDLDFIERRRWRRSAKCPRRSRSSCPGIPTPAPPSTGSSSSSCRTGAAR